MHKIDRIWHTHDGVVLDLEWNTVLVNSSTKIWIHKHSASSTWLVSIVPNNDRARRFEVGSAETVSNAAHIANVILEQNRVAHARNSF